MDADRITKLFNDMPEGAHFISDVDFNITYIKPVQDQSYHLDTMVISLTTGEAVHYSRVIGTQVHWGTWEDTEYYPYSVFLKET